jgi:hypothetical protein
MSRVPKFCFRIQIMSAHSPKTFKNGKGLTYNVRTLPWVSQVRTKIASFFSKQPFTITFDGEKLFISQSNYRASRGESRGTRPATTFQQNGIENAVIDISWKHLDSWGQGVAIAYQCKNITTISFFCPFI